MRESRSPPSFQGEALADNSGGASLSFERERGVIDVLYVLNVYDVPIVIVVLNVLNVFLVHCVFYYPYVHNVIIVPHVPDVFSLRSSCFQSHLLF